MKIAILTDLHYGNTSPIPQRRSRIAPILLKRAVRRLNRRICPDITIVLGDLLDDGSRPDASDRLACLRSILDGLNAPYIAIPGNHDGDVDSFYRVFDRPQVMEDFSGVRFLPFWDQEEAGYNATRSLLDIDRMRVARHDFSGPIVMMQHTCLFPPGRLEAPYNYLNATEIVESMRCAGNVLSVSGHYHQGAKALEYGDLNFVSAPALCEAPFRFNVLTLDESGKVEVDEHMLAMPLELGLVDSHLHTELAYCSDDMTVQSTIDLAADFGLGGVIFTEHSGQLYFDRDQYWSKACLRDGMASARPEDSRMEEYLDMKYRYEQGRIRFGIEADCDYNGHLLIAPADSARFDCILGSIHGLQVLPSDASPDPLTNDHYLYLVEKTLEQGVSVLAHPFRVFRRSHLMVPQSLFLPTATLLKKYGVAAEINFHTNEPPLEFVRICLELGVKFALGSDAHDLSEVGDFADHLSLLKEAGFDGDLMDILQFH